MARRRASSSSPAVASSGALALARAFLAGRRAGGSSSLSGSSKMASVVVFGFGFGFAGGASAGSAFAAPFCFVICPIGTSSSESGSSNMASVVLLALRAGSAFAGAGASSTAGAAGSRAAPFLPFFGVALPETSAEMGISSSESLLDMVASSKAVFGDHSFRLWWAPGAGEGDLSVAGRALTALSVPRVASHQILGRLRSALETAAMDAEPGTQHSCASLADRVRKRTRQLLSASAAGSR